MVHAHWLPLPRATAVNTWSTEVGAHDVMPKASNFRLGELLSPLEKHARANWLRKTVRGPSFPGSSCELSAANIKTPAALLDTHAQIYLHAVLEPARQCVIRANSLRWLSLHGQSTDSCVHCVPNGTAVLGGREGFSKIRLTAADPLRIGGKYPPHLVGV